MVHYGEFRILLVEDSPTSAALASHWLKAGLGTPFVLHTVTHLDAALEFLRSGVVDLTILDLNLAESVGLETFRAIHTPFRDVPIVVLSGDSDEELAVEAVRLGAQDYVVKTNDGGNPLARPVRFAWERVQRHRAEIAWQTNERQLQLARSIQRDLLPDGPPRLDGFDIACRCESAELVGGDYFDFIPLPSGALGMVIADVSGHGIAAAMMMIEVRAIFRSLAREALSLNQILEKTNELITPDLDQRFVTALFGVLQPQSRTFQYGSAGHPAMIISSGGDVHPLESFGMPLGVHHGTMGISGEISLMDGDLLALYTDGLVERLNPQDGVFGTARFADSLCAHRHQPADQIVDKVFQTAREFSGGLAHPDDETLVIVKVEPTEPDLKPGS